MFSRSAAAVVLSAGMLFAAWAQMASGGRTPLDSHRSLGAPKSFRNLTLIPVYDSAARSSGDYVTLDEGLSAKWVVVKEAKGGGSVNTLYITNTGPKPVYIMAGEVVLGGQQDRCLGKDMVVAPGKRGVPITVFCVEHGRWTGRSDFGDSAKTVASADIRAEAQNGAFSVDRAYGAAPAASQQVAGSRVARRSLPALAEGSPAAATVGRSQQQVWDKVEQKNRRFKAGSPTGTYRGVLNMAGGEARQSIAPYLKAFSTGLGGDPHLVGVVAAVNGRVVAADLFGDPALFRKLWPKLLRSYAADAAESSGAGSRATATPAMAKAFLLSATDGAAKAENRSDVVTTLRLDSKEATTYRLIPASKPIALHENVLRK